MSVWSILVLLISGGILTVLGGFAQSLWSERGEERRSKRTREEDIADRKFELKKDAYFEALKEFNLSGSAKFNGAGDYKLSEEEFIRRTSAMTLFDMYATSEIKSKAVICIQLFQVPIPSDATAKAELNTRVLDALRDLSQAVRKDLDIDEP